MIRQGEEQVVGPFIRLSFAERPGERALLHTLEPMECEETERKEKQAEAERRCKVTQRGRWRKKTGRLPGGREGSIAGEEESGAWAGAGFPRAGAALGKKPRVMAGLRKIDNSAGRIVAVDLFHH